MKEHKKLRINTTTLNLICSLFFQVVYILNGFILPRLLLSYFGSETNGLVASISKFLGYIVIFEGGMSAVVCANLFKPLIDNDKEKISSIYKTTSIFYKKISIAFAIYAIILACVYPLIFKTSFSYEYVFWLVIILSINSFVQYCFSVTNRNLLNADRKVYIVTLVQALFLILDVIVSYFVLKYMKNIHLAKLIVSIIYMVQPIILGIYVKKHYSINKKAPKDKKLLASRWDGFSLIFADFIHTNTDVMLLSFFTDMKTVSIYSVYALVCSGTRALISALSRAIAPSLGKLYAKEDEEYLGKFSSLYEYIILIIVFIFIPVACMLISPFALLYTIHATDINYSQPIFGALLLISEGFYLLKLPHTDLSYSANKFKEIKKYKYIEAGINIIVSIVLLQFFGLIGVAIGTLVSMLYSLIMFSRYTYRNILKDRLSSFYLKIVKFSLVSVIGVIVCLVFVFPVEINYISFIIHGIIYTAIFVALHAITSLVFFRKEISNIYNTFIKKA